MTSKPTKHMHLVQKEYLKAFSVTENNRHFIWRFDKTTEESKKLPIKAVAMENFFYDQEIETWLAEEIETPGIAVIKKIIDEESIENLTSPEKIKVAKWILIQDTRTREYREVIKQGFEHVGNRLIKFKFPGIKLQVTEGLTKDVQTHMMQRFESYAPNIANYNWCLCINNTEQLLYTSDHPVIKNNSYVRTLERFSGRESFNPGTGYFSKGVEINLPLSPRLFLILADISPAFDMLKNLPESENYLLYQVSPAYKTMYNDMVARVKRLTRKRQELASENVLHYNNRITSYKYIFSRNNNFEMVIDCLLNNPESKKY